MSKTVAVRKVQGLHEAHFCEPVFPKVRLTGAQARGIAFENRNRKVLGPSFYHGQWIKFVDDNGPGYCQPDHFKITKDRILLVEDKLSETARAEAQLRRLYAPVLAYMYGLPVALVQCFKYLKTRPLDPIDHAMEALRRPLGIVYTWHNIG